jgi:hypothetical protein
MRIMNLEKAEDQVFGSPNNDCDIGVHRALYMWAQSLAFP